MNHYSSEEIVNIGTGQDISIAELAHLICDIVGYSGKICFDDSKPDGTPRKVLDVSKLNGLGWQPQIALPDGVADLYRSVDKSDWAGGVEGWK